MYYNCVTDVYNTTGPIWFIMKRLDGLHRRAIKYNKSLLIFFGGEKYKIQVALSHKYVWWDMWLRSISRRKIVIGDYSSSVKFLLQWLIF